MKPQLKELIENYDPSILWFDGEWIDDFTHEQGMALYKYIRELKPDIIVNNRVDKGRQGMQGMNAEGEFAGDFDTPEQEILEEASDLDWESCMTMNDTWGFNQTNNNWKSAAQLVHNLVDVTAKGGNYLLNIGPTGEGEVPAPSVQRLQQIGDWLSTNGEAIYNTQKFEKNYRQTDSNRYTRKENSVYAIKLDKLPNTISFKYIKPSKNSTVTLLGYGTLKWEFTEANGLTVYIPKEMDMAKWANTRAWTFKVDKAEELK